MNSKEVLRAFFFFRLFSRIIEALGRNIAQHVALLLEPTIKQMKEQGEEIIALGNQISVLRDENVRLKRELNSVDMHSKTNKLIIKGLPEASYAEASSRYSGEDLANDEQLIRSYTACQTAAVNFCTNQLGIPLARSDIATAFRMKKLGSDEERPLFITFANRQARDQVYQACVKLKGQNIFINEHLTRTYGNIFAESRRLLKDKKILNTWTMNGAIFILKSEGSKPIKIKDMSDLDGL